MNVGLGDLLTGWLESGGRYYKFGAEDMPLGAVPGRHDWLFKIWNSSPKIHLKKRSLSLFFYADSAKFVGAKEDNMLRGSL